LKRTLAILALALAAGLPVSTSGEVSELVLRDGRVLEGIDVRRDGEIYLVRVESGGVITIPVVFVREVRLVGKAQERAEESAARQGPTGIGDAKPQTLGGTTVTAPKTSEQLAVLGEPAKFQDNIIDPTWTPTSDWDNDPLKGNNWNPAKWSESIIDPTWEPTSAFDRDEDVMESGKSTFQKSIVDSSWEPTDGFKKKSF